MAAAQAAARAFVADQPRSVRIGLVAFSSSAMVAQAPTLSRDDLTAAIDRLRPQRYTAVGSGIVASLQAIFPDVEAELATTVMTRPRIAPLGEKKPEPPKPGPQAVPPGSYTAAVIILLTDGQTNAGVPPLDAARLAADRGVRVFTVGFGSAQGGLVDFGGGSMRVQLDEETLKAIAEMTQARYFHAVNENDLREIYKSLTAQFVAETKRTELTAMVAAPAMILLLLAVVLSLLWSNRMR
jgi:Ca-activated chloride channel family protein